MYQRQWQALHRAQGPRAPAIGKGGFFFPPVGSTSSGRDGQPNIPNTGSRFRAPRLNSVRERTGLGDPLPFEIFQAFLGGGVAQVKSAAIPGRGPSGVAQSTANTSPAEET